MDIKKIVNELYFFAQKPRIFSLREIADLSNFNVNPEELKNALISDSRFLHLNNRFNNENLFISDSALFSWFCRLNLRLAQIQQFKLKEYQVASLFNYIRHEDKLNSMPINAIHWGQRLGLICSALTRNQYVFPLAKILSFMKRGIIKIVGDVLIELCEDKIWNISLKNKAKELIQERFLMLSDQISYIVKSREGLLTGTKITLQELGDLYNLTRERIRQLEEKFWNSLFLYKNRRPFIKAFLYDFMSNSGSIVIRTDSSRALWMRFLAKCVGIPQIELTTLGLLIIGFLPKDISRLERRKWFPNEVGSNAIEKVIESKYNIPFSAKDIRKLAKRISKYRQKKLTLTQRAYLTLRYIGNPAHYLKIAKIHNFLYPNYEVGEYTIHNALVKQKYGVVWIGIKGVYALKEWGYERPKKTIFKTVEEIVQSKYTEFGKPIPKAIIISELGKYRKIINPSSIAIAIYCNPNLQRIDKDSFIPRVPSEQDQEDISLEELDKVLKEFKDED